MHKKQYGEYEYNAHTNITFEMDNIVLYKYVCGCDWHNELVLIHYCGYRVRMRAHRSEAISYYNI